jgi:hypothetical protein
MPLRAVRRGFARASEPAAIGRILTLSRLRCHRTNYCADAVTTVLSPCSLAFIFAGGAGANFGAFDSLSGCPQ